MTTQPKRRFPWGILTVLFAIAAVLFLLAAGGTAILSNSLTASVHSPTPTISTIPSVQATGTVTVPATPVVSPTPSPCCAAPPAFWPPTATTVTDVLAVMGGISSIGTLISFMGLLGRGGQNLAKRLRRAAS
ncbi:MAG: hypothetical protein ACLQUY_13995 [Ktedonobacterales bacterium]